MSWVFAGASFGENCGCSVAVGVAVQAMLGGMPLAADLRRAEVDDEVLIAVGSRVLFRYEAGDAGLRNRAAAGLRLIGDWC